MGLNPGTYQVGTLTVHVDRLEPPQESKFDQEGWEYYRNCLVEGLAGSGSDQMRQAVAAIQACPVNPSLTIGSPHPTIADARLKSFRPRPQSVGTVAVRLVYVEQFGEDAKNLVEVGATAQQVQTNLDVNGAQLKTFTFGKNYGHTASRLVPNTKVRVTRTEYASPGDKAKTYVGTVNEGGWDLDPSASPRCWLCTSIEGKSDNAGVTWRVTYEFVYQPPKSTDSNNYAGGWDEAMVPIDPSTGQPFTNFYNKLGQQNTPDYAVIYPSESFAFGFVV